MEKGLTHLYYGDGKGKTTAAVGLCIRAAGNGKHVLFIQFMKDDTSGEISILKKIQGVDVFCGHVPRGFYGQMDDETKKLFAGEQERLLCRVIELIDKEKGEDNMLLVMDEITYAYSWNLIDRMKLENLINNKPDFLEIVMTGRNPEKFLVDAADYVTEMKCEKHPFKKGIAARKGVEF